MSPDILDYVNRMLLNFPDPTKEVDQLTNQERIALCIASGCKMDYRTEGDSTGGYRMVATTVNPVGIVKVSDRFIVCERRTDGD